tara:strand:- start:3983 stop:4084 length:102 start_codon:yes stop_codon:yes gene_type:complete
MMATLPLHTGQDLSLSTARPEKYYYKIRVKRYN